MNIGNLILIRRNEGWEGGRSLNAYAKRGYYLEYCYLKTIQKASSTVNSYWSDMLMIRLWFRAFSLQTNALWRGALFISWACATECSQVPSQIWTESLTFFTMTNIRTFCHLSVMCVVYSGMEIVSQKKK